MKSPQTPNNSPENNTIVSFPSHDFIEDITAMPNSSVINSTPANASMAESTAKSSATNYPNYLQWVGGRKQLNGYIGAILLTGMAIFLKADFPHYATAVLVSLGITSFSVATEDAFKKR